MTTTTLTSWHAAVLNALRALPFVRRAEHYPEDLQTPLETPCVLLSLDDWENAGRASGETEVELAASLHLVCDKSAAGEPAPEVYARELAAQLSQWVNGHTFGLPDMSPAVFTTAQRDGFDPSLDGYIVMRVDFVQRLALGPDLFERTGAPLKQVMLGRAPEIGAAHAEKYIPLPDNFPGSRP
ncbi:hypothetical protein M7963_18635 [Enterobacter roggenkampii]|uniref:hypothetical protein n=1 Tax=Enterobacter roggenkampii TaxID=1812935 RepID=UPI002236F1F6|nr:hypothetical protein [Enterobacter roggenkampii]MCW5003533.1 hypothetical protein [Enterobacter roggenkampii]